MFLTRAKEENNPERSSARNPQHSSSKSMWIKRTHTLAIHTIGYTFVLKKLLTASNNMAASFQYPCAAFHYIWINLLSLLSSIPNILFADIKIQLLIQYEQAQFCFFVFLMLQICYSRPQCSLLHFSIFNTPYI